MAAAGDYLYAGMRLRKRRKEMKLSQVELATRAGMSERTLSDMEKGKSANYQEVSALMDAVGWTPQSWVDMLAGREPTPVPVGASDYVSHPMDRSAGDTGSTVDDEILEKLDAMHQDIADMNNRLATVEKRLDERP